MYWSIIWTNCLQFKHCCLCDTQMEVIPCCQLPLQTPFWKDSEACFSTKPVLHNRRNPCGHNFQLHLRQAVSLSLSLAGINWRMSLLTCSLHKTTAVWIRNSSALLLFLKYLWRVKINITGIPTLFLNAVANTQMWINRRLSILNLVCTVYRGALRVSYETEKNVFFKKRNLLKIFAVKLVIENCINTKFDNGTLMAMFISFDVIVLFLWFEQ